MVGIGLCGDGYYWEMVDMNDKELLELAAKAAGIILQNLDGNQHPLNAFFTENGAIWNPLEDDGDALCLAVKLRLGIDFRAYATEVKFGNGESVTEKTDIGYGNEEATRRAIVCASAEIGRMK